MSAMTDLRPGGTALPEVPRYRLGPMTAEPYAWPYDGSVDAASACYSPTAPARPTAATATPPCAW